MKVTIYNCVGPRLCHCLVSVTASSLSLPLVCFCENYAMNLKLSHQSTDKFKVVEHVLCIYHYVLRHRNMTTANASSCDVTVYILGCLRHKQEGRCEKKAA